jgi:hypothetical protein
VSGDTEGPQHQLVGDEVPLPKTVEAVAFWSAIALPFVYLPLLLVGLQTVSLQAAFALLVALNGVAILLGHQYGR